MKVVKSNMTVYESADGKRFFDKESCVDYEKNAMEELNNMRYFKYLTNRDLNETGMFYKQSYCAVYLPNYDSCYKEVLMQHLLDLNNGNILGENVQGYGIASLFAISEISKDAYFNKEPNKWGGHEISPEQILLSNVEFEGYPVAIKIKLKGR